MSTNSNNILEQLAALTSGLGSDVKTLTETVAAGQQRVSVRRKCGSCMHLRYCWHNYQVQGKPIRFDSESCDEYKDGSWQDNLPIFHPPADGTLLELRLLPIWIPRAQHRIEFTNKKGEAKSFRVFCRNFDPTTETYLGIRTEVTDALTGNSDVTYVKDCIVCKAIESGAPLSPYPQRVYLVGALAIDDNAKKALSRPTKIDGDAYDFTQFHFGVIQVPQSVQKKISELKPTNRHWVRTNPETGRLEAAEPESPGSREESFSLDHALFGMSVFIAFDPKKSGTDMWTAQRGDKMPVRASMLPPSLPDISGIVVPPSAPVLEKDMRRLTLLRALENQSCGRCKHFEDCVNGGYKIAADTFAWFCYDWELASAATETVKKEETSAAPPPGNRIEVPVTTGEAVKKAEVQAVSIAPPPQQQTASYGVSEGPAVDDGRGRAAETRAAPKVVTNASASACPPQAGFPEVRNGFGAYFDFMDDRCSNCPMNESCMMDSGEQI